MYAVPIILVISITTIVGWMLLFIIIVIMYLGNVLTLWYMRETGSVRHVSRVGKDLVFLYLLVVLVLKLCRG